MRRSGRKRTGFTLVEVMVAMSILMLVFVSSIAGMTISFRVLEDARMNTLASQILQSEMENIRLKNWTQISALPADATFTVESSLNTTSFQQFSCSRAVRTLNSDLKIVEVAVSWESMDGRVHDRRYVTVVGRNGLNDYFYRSL